MAETQTSESISTKLERIAKLAREAEMCYTTIALITDYDCWHPAHDEVTVDMIVATLPLLKSTVPEADLIGGHVFEHAGAQRDQTEQGQKNENADPAETGAKRIEQG